MEDREAAEEKARERKAVRDGWELAKKQKEKSLFAISDYSYSLRGF